MIKTVTVINYLREAVKIKLSDMSPSHGLIITDMSGLGPPKANINTTTIIVTIFVICLFLEYKI